MTPFDPRNRTRNRNSDILYDYLPFLERKSGIRFEWTIREYELENGVSLYIQL